MNFKKYFHITEIAQHHVDKISTDLEDLLKHKKLPFNDSFGDKVRFAEKLNGGIKYELNIKKYGDDFDYDFSKWTGYKKNDLIKKNPIRIGKILTKQKDELTKQLKISTNTPAQISEIKFKIEHVDELIQTTNLQKQYEMASNQPLFLIYSRAPIDVLRMSDQSWRSCHSPERDYFKCALADAQMNAGIVYLVKEEDYEKIKNNLQANEIFVDKDRNKTSDEYIDPLARIRLRALIDEDGKTLAVPSAKIYGKNDYKMNNDFVNQVLEWAKKQNVDNFNWTGILTMPGGSYQDYGHEIETYVKKIWGKDVDVVISNDENELDNDHRQEHILDEYRQLISDNEITDRLLGSGWESDIPLKVDYNNYTGEISLSYNISDIIHDKIKDKPNIVIQPKHTHYKAEVQGIELNFIGMNDISIEDYLDDNNDRFNASDFMDSIVLEIERCLESFINMNSFTGQESRIELRMALNKLILDGGGVGENYKFENMDVDSFIDNFVGVIKYNHINTNAKILETNINGLKYDIQLPFSASILPEIEISEKQRNVLTTTIDNIINGLGGYLISKYDVVNNVTDFIVPSITIFDKFSAEWLNKNNSKLNKCRIFSAEKYTNSANIPKLKIQLLIHPSRFNDLVDSGKLNQVDIAFNELLTGDSFESEFRNITNIFDLEDALQKYIITSKDDNQLDLDLSKVNIFMTSDFDTYIETLMEDLANAGKNGIAQRTTTSQPNVQQNQVPPTTSSNNVKMKFNNGTQTPANNTQNNNTNNQTGGDDEASEFGQYHSLSQSNPAEYTKTLQKLASMNTGKFQRYLTTLVPQTT